MSEQINVPQYGALINECVIALESAAIDMNAVDAENFGTARTVLVGAKLTLEDLERRLSATRPNKELRGFHGDFVRAIRGIILGHGSLARMGTGSARFYYTRALEQLNHGAQALRQASIRDADLVQSLGLTRLAQSRLLGIEEPQQQTVEPLANLRRKFCTQCGAGVNARQNFCTECGMRTA